MRNINSPYIKLVGFDVWNTLLRLRRNTSPDKIYANDLETWAVMLEYVREAYGSQYADPDNWMAVYKQTRIVAERMSEISGRHVGMTERVIMTLFGLGISENKLQISELEPVVQKTIANIANTPMELVDDRIIERLVKLRELGIAVGIVSNLGAITANYVRESLRDIGFGHFDIELYSDEVGLCKPNPAIFGELCHRVGVSPEKTLFIGDNFEADYLGALNCGMKAVWLSGHPRPNVVSAVNVSEALQLFGLC